MDPPVAAPTNSIGPSLVSPMTPSLVITNQSNVGMETYTSGDNKDGLIIRQEHYRQQMLTDFNQLELDMDNLSWLEPIKDAAWLEPIKDAACQVECVLLQILYPGIQTSDKVTQPGMHQPPDMLDELLHKLRDISHGSKQLIQLFQPFVQEIVEQEFGIQRLINSSMLEDVLTTLKEKANYVAKLSAKDVRLDVLLQDFKDVTSKFWRTHDHSIVEVIRKMAKCIHNCKNSISLLCMETSQSTVIELNTSPMQRSSGHNRYNIHTIDWLIYLADQLADAFNKIKCSRDRLFDNDFSYNPFDIMRMDKEAAPTSDLFENLSFEYTGRLKDFLKDTEALQQSYNNWKKLERQKYTMDAFIKEHSTGDIRFKFDPEYALLDVVMQWDPFNSMSCIGHAVVSLQILSREVSSGSLRINNLQDYVETVSRFAHLHLKDFLHCLINANVEGIQVHSCINQHQHYFCDTSSVSSLSGELHGSPSYISSHSSAHSTSHFTLSTDTQALMISPQRLICTIEEESKLEEEYDGQIFYLFSKAISNLKQLTDMLVQKECVHVLSEPFREALQEAIEQKMLLLGFHQQASDGLEKLGSMEASALRERRRDWERAFMVVVHELLPWPKFLFEVIFSHNNNELKEACFYECAELCLKPLLEFADAACSALPGQAKRIFHQLHVYEVLGLLSDNISHLSIMDPPSRLIRWSFDQEVENILKRLKEAILEALADFRSQILDDQSFINNNEVDVHHLTRSTMSYMKELSSHSRSIDSLNVNYYSFSGREKSILSGLESEYKVVMRDDSFGCWHYMLLSYYLETKLMEKSQLLKDSVAAQVFRINNLNYMMEKVASPQLTIIFGEECYQNLDEKVQGYVNSFKALVWAEVESCSVRAMRATKWINILYSKKAEIRLSSFISSIMERSKPWASWKVPNPSMRSALRNILVDVVVSVYTDLWYKLHPKKLKNNIVDKSIQKELKDLKSHILYLFEG